MSCELFGADTIEKLLSLNKPSHCPAPPLSNCPYVRGVRTCSRKWSMRARCVVFRAHNRLRRVQNPFAICTALATVGRLHVTDTIINRYRLPTVSQSTLWFRNENLKNLADGEALIRSIGVAMGNYGRLKTSPNRPLEFYERYGRWVKSYTESTEISFHKTRLEHDCKFADKNVTIY